MLVDNFQFGMWLIIDVVLIGLAVFTFVDALLRREDAFRAADKQTKPMWLILLGVTLAVNLLLPGMFILKIIGAVATIVYAVDVRPALKQVTGNGPRRGGSSSDGPYGPYNGGR
ncbi:DUF2516 family protein [Streptomyces sp. AJS327]|uniref:DUF2516 family protein n=1 Tax=Streptomyces sp. AJS327 TaxID=2545265 RepID=UPI0015DE2239|nr:DUF2516 family protein [Streptomyces sp. AJS327]MBA0053817.1 DUF2516 family protein [Streptomyces sp. AJS327]